MGTKLYQINRLNHQLQEDLMRQKNQSNALEKDLLSSANKYEDLRQLKDNIQRERDNLRSDVTKLNNLIADLRHTIMMNSITIDGLHLDINKLNVKLDEAKIAISKAEKERDEMAQEMETLHERIEYFQEQIQIKTEQVTDLTEKLQQKHFQLINVKKQLETAHSEKMVLKRALDTCTQERDDFRNINTKNAHQIAQLSNEISANQNKINALNLKIERLNNDKKELQTDLKNTQNVLTSVRRDLKEMRNKNENLMKTINDDELKFMKISQELEETRKERNLIGLQMVRRNDEIILIKEKLSIMQNALDNGTTQYNQRVEDIRLLKMEINNLQTERECLSRALKSTADMREEIIRLQRLLNQERIRVRSLTEDAKTPTGVHRWRILKGEDPHKFQLLQKLQILQKRNLKQEVAKSNLKVKLRETTSMCDSLKHIVENLPKSDVKEKLVKAQVFSIGFIVTLILYILFIIFQRINRQQEKQLKTLTAELAIHRIELDSQRCIIEDYKARLTVSMVALSETKANLSKARLSQIKQEEQQTETNKKPVEDEALHETVLYTMSYPDILPLCAEKPNDNDTI